MWEDCPMGVIGQCMDIINLTSLAWKGQERYSVVAHSFRVMAKAKNDDELVVGMMHELYAASSYTRALYHCDVDGDPQWGMSLDLLTPPLKTRHIAKTEEIPEVSLLEANMPRFCSDKLRDRWMIQETRWTPKYFEWIRKIGKDRIARNVMIYDLSDKLDILLNPKKYVDELGPQWFVLPWKKHYCIPIKQGRSSIMSMDIPTTEDPLLLRDITDDERENLIDKYTRALDYLRWIEDEHPSECVFSKEEQKEHANLFKQWFNNWVAEEEADKAYYEQEIENVDEQSEGNENAGVPAGDDRPSC